MNTNTKYVIGFVVGIVVVLGIIAFINNKTQESGAPTVDFSSFAQCIKDKGIIFYGAFWCPHCQATKRMFGSAAKLLPYVECSTPDANAQTQICIDKGITQYPTWVFPDGLRISGEQTLQTLSEKSGCQLPAGVATTSAAAVPATGSSSSAVAQ